MVNFKLYMVQNSDDEFFAKPKQYGPDWTSNIDKARLYTKQGYASAIVNRYIDLDHPEDGPFVLEFDCKETWKIDESEKIKKKRIAKAKNAAKIALKAEQEKLKRLERRVREAEKELKEAQGMKR